MIVIAQTIQLVPHHYSLNALVSMMNIVATDDNVQDQGIPIVNEEGECEENITLQSPSEQQAQVFSSEELLDKQTLPSVSPNHVTLQSSVSQNSFGYVNVIDKLNVDMNVLPA